MLGQFRLKHGGIGGKEIAQLIDHSRESPAPRRRREFIQVHRHHPPRTLHHELHEETTSNQKRNRRRKDPGRDKQDPADRYENDRAPASPVLRKMSKQRSAADRTEIINDRNRRGLIDRKPALFLEKGGVKILGAVRHVIEGRHQQHGVNEKAPMFSKESSYA